MSLEAKIEALTAAVAQLTATLQAQTANVPQAAAPAQPVVAAPAAVATPVQAAAMPAPPTFTAPAAAPVAAPAGPAAPFADVQGLIQYTMGAYQQMGPQKGAGIQGILTQLGYGNINDVQPQHFGQFYAAVEQLKVS